MDLIADRGRRVPIEELNTTRLLAHARKQAHQRNLDDMLIVDVDAHHYENENMKDILPFMENDVLRQLSISAGSKSRGSVMPQNIGYQDMGGRVTRYPMRSSEKTPEGKSRDVELGHRWMDAMSVDYSCLFPTGMLTIGLHPQTEMEVDLCWAYNRWLTEKVLPESSGRFFSMLSLPFSDPDESLRQIETFGDSQARRRLHGDDRAQQHGGARQPLHESLPGDGGARPGALVPFRAELGRADLQQLQPFPLRARARIHLVQRGQSAPTG